MLARRLLSGTIIALIILVDAVGDGVEWCSSRWRSTAMNSSSLQWKQRMESLRTYSGRSISPVEITSSGIVMAAKVDGLPHLLRARLGESAISAKTRPGDRNERPRPGTPNPHPRNRHQGLAQRAQLGLPACAIWTVIRQEG